MTKRQGCVVILLDNTPCMDPVAYFRWRVRWDHSLGREPLCDKHYRAVQNQAGPVPDGAGGWKESI